MLSGYTVDEQMHDLVMQKWAAQRAVQDHEARTKSVEAILREAALANVQFAVALGQAGLGGVLLTACSSSAATSQPPEPTLEPAAQPQAGGHPPVILRVVERQQVIDGFLWLYQDVYFADPDGDAIAMTYAPISSSLTYPLIFTDNPIKATAEEQKAEALFTVPGSLHRALQIFRSLFDNKHHASIIRCGLMLGSRSPSPYWQEGVPGRSTTAHMRKD